MDNIIEIMEDLEFREFLSNLQICFFRDSSPQVWNFYSMNEVGSFEKPENPEFILLLYKMKFLPLMKPRQIFSRLGT